MAGTAPRPAADGATALSIQTETLTADTSIVFSAASTNQILLTGTLLAVTVTSAAIALTCPPATDIDQGAVAFWVLNSGGSTKTLELKNSAGTHLRYLQPGEAALISRSAAGTAILAVLQGVASYTEGVPSTTSPSINRRSSITFNLPANGSGSTVNHDIAAGLLPANFVIEDAMLISQGATGGTVRVQTAAGAANITDAMVPGNASVITRAASLTYNTRTLTSAAAFRIAVATGAPATYLVLNGVLAI
jgi:hypothetical protein